MQRTNIGKAAIHASAAVMGAWLAFHPLVASAQEAKAPREAAAKPLSAPAKGENTISFSNAQNAPQKHVCAYPHAGQIRISVENKDSTNLNSCLRDYARLVDMFADMLQNDLKIAKGDHFQFANKIYDVIRGAGYGYGNEYRGYMYLSLAYSTIDCDNAAILVFDIARKMGIPAKVAFGRSSYGPHAIVKIGDLYLDMNNGLILSSNDMRKVLLAFYFETANPDTAAYTAYENLGLREQRAGNYGVSISYLAKAILLAPKAANLYLIQAKNYYLMGDVGKTISNLNWVKAFDPNYPKLSIYFQEALLGKSGKK